MPRRERALRRGLVKQRREDVGLGRDVLQVSPSTAVSVHSGP